ncbi:uncharacterized protein with FMN-binding domain [Microbacterium sp. AG790]|uniref:FMN-binding protein n=1 Tax=Microbacterium sp. AG790 TaxID=2183995 RepID=UPI000EB408D0|nr:FMN-binding protein [Microbacterium sp. AG790]RKS93226.1 uncharacterized protein with FMN-binding domain [Microbacterium sp. AG790]
MKRIVYALLATVSGLVLLFSYRTSLPEEAAAAAPADTTLTDARHIASAPRAASPSPSPSPSAASPSGSADTGGTGAAGATSRTGLSDGTFTGSAVNTRYGAVQVQITVSGGVITDVQTPAYPDHSSRDRQINQDALPQLISETLSAQSAQIDMVSGATYTSTGYLDSLQSAIDQASA